VLWPPRSIHRGLVHALLPLAFLISASGAWSEPRRWTPAPGKCEVFFDATHPLGPFSGRTENVQGEFQLDPSDLKLGLTGSLRISARGLKTGEESRDRAMQKALGVDQYPEIRYTIDTVEASFASVSERPDVLLTINGRLTIHGVERPVPFPGRVRRRDDGLWVRGETKIKMTDFGISPPRRLFFKVNDTVLVSFDVLLVEHN
jgi:polyisoprenoid-binding protein YceI